MRRRKDLLEEISALDHLHFSQRARKRARRRRMRSRLAITGWIVSVGAAAAFGLRAPDGVGILAALERSLFGSDEIAIDSADTTTTGATLARPTPDGGPAGRGRGRETDPVGFDPVRPAAALPSASPTPEVVPSPDSITEIIYAAANEFGLGAQYLLSVAHCESTLNPYAYNAAGYHGLFQFDYTTWNAYGYGDIYDPVAQARTAARLLAAGESSRWPNCA